MSSETTGSLRTKTEFTHDFILQYQASRGWMIRAVPFLQRNTPKLPSGTSFSSETEANGTKHTLIECPNQTVCLSTHISCPLYIMKGPDFHATFSWNQYGTLSTCESDTSLFTVITAETPGQVCLHITQDHVVTLQNYSHPCSWLWGQRRKTDSSI